MALDTAKNRASAVYVGLPWRTALPLPDGLPIDSGDRQSAGLSYSGIAAATAVVAALGALYQIRDQAPALYERVVQSLVDLPAFQADAFQNDAFQVGGSYTLGTSAAVNPPLYKQRTTQPKLG